MKSAMNSSTNAAVRARLGRCTPHGVIDTPVFMPVGTQATVKGIAPEELEGLGADYPEQHLSPVSAAGARAGARRRRAAPLHALGPSHSDRLGGFQVFSLSDLRHITEEGWASSPIWTGPAPVHAGAVHADPDGPGSDIVMAFDECTPYPADDTYTKNSWSAPCAGWSAATGP